MKNRTDFWVRISLLLGDLAAITLFVFLGQQDHGTTDLNNPLLGLLRASFPFLITWIIVALIVGAYPPAAEISTRRVILRGLNAWLIAAPLGLLLRAYLLQRGTIPPIFMLLTLLIGGAFVLIWRLLFVFIWQRRRRRQQTLLQP